MPAKEVIKLQSDRRARIKQWKVTIGTTLYEGRIVLLYEEEDEEGGTDKQSQKPKCVKLKSKRVGTVSKLCVKEGDLITPGSALFEIDLGCSHPVVINELCAECGADLQKEETPSGCLSLGSGGIGLGEGRSPAASSHPSSAATIPMVHSIPQLKVSHEQAQQLGRADTERLLKEKKLVLLVDLDQTLIHTTHDNIPNNLKDVHHFQLFGSQNPWYHTRLRPGTNRFLTEMYKYYELHICTFGVRPYAHMVAHILDKDAKLFSNRILSRDECFDYNSKVANLQALFPCGDELVCIIDDREDVWNFSGNLIPVKPYHFFKNTGGDIHDPNLPPAVKTSHFFAKGVKVKTKKSDGAASITFNNLSKHCSEGETQQEDNEKKKVKKREEDDEEDTGEKTTEGTEDEIKREEKRMKKDDSTSGDETVESSSEEDSVIKKNKKNNEKKIEDLLDEVEEEEEEVKPEEELPEEDVLDVEDEDDYLLYLEVILKQVHSLFYRIYNKEEEGVADVKWVIKELKNRVLRGCHLVFSGLVPVNNNGLNNKNNTPTNNGKRNSNNNKSGGDRRGGEGWMHLAKDLGAEVDQDLIPQVTTHLIAANPTTLKVHRAIKMKGVFVVKPKWLITCAHRWERVEEKLFEYGVSGMEEDEDDCSSNMMMMMLMTPPGCGSGGGATSDQTGDDESIKPEQEQQHEKVVLSQAVVEAMKDEFEEEFTSTDEDDDEDDEEEGTNTASAAQQEEEDQEGDDEDDDEENNHPDISDFEDMRGSNSEGEDKEDDDDEEWSQLAHQIERGLDDGSIGMDFEENDDR